ncbi:peptidogalycan biosysnthesis protein, partial [Escherichia coli]|uniref:peptidogalycan biosysnthesis protein n=1 Tax=Escherichia coli TaxID=562 RepID=UPI001FCF1A4B
MPGNQAHALRDHLALLHLPYPSPMPSPRFLDSLQSIPASDWDALHDGRNPFVSHAFLSGLEQHGCLR